MSFQVQNIVQYVKSVITAQLCLLYEPSYSPESSVITPGLLQGEIDIKQPCPHIKNSPFGEVFPGPPCIDYSCDCNAIENWPPSL